MLFDPSEDPVCVLGDVGVDAGVALGVAHAAAAAWAPAVQAHEGRDPIDLGHQRPSTIFRAGLAN